MNTATESLKRSIQSISESDTALKAATEGLEHDANALDGQLEQIRRLRPRETAPAAKDAAEPKVSRECAEFLGATAIAGALGAKRLERVNPQKTQALYRRCEDILDTHTRSALTGSDIPLTPQYTGELSQLVNQYGRARQYCNVVNIGASTSYFPRLKTDPAFGFIDMSAAVPEKVPQTEFVGLTPAKAGGIVRVPFEIDADSIVDLGMMLADYAAREIAKWEDTVCFIGDGSATYKTMKGAAKDAADAGYKHQLGSGDTAPSDTELSDLRLLRSKVVESANRNGKYYFHHSWEAFLVTLNTVTSMPHYKAKGRNGKPTLDGYEIEWIETLPVYSETASASAIVGLFGDLSYYFLGLLGQIDIRVSPHVYFATDEIGFRVLERFAGGLMADGSVAALQLAAS